MIDANVDLPIASILVQKPGGLINKAREKRLGDEHRMEASVRSWITCLIGALGMSGCAITSISRDQSLSPVDPSASLPPGLELRCHGRMISMMLFPLVPLPPIIPTPNRRDSAAQIRIRPAELRRGLYRIAIVSAARDDVPLFDYSDKELSRYAGYLNVGHICRDLDGAVMELYFAEGGDTRTEKYRLVFSESWPKLRLAYFLGA